MILNNLFSNAIRYHDKHKKNPFVKVHVTIFKSEAFVEIEDNGIGIEQTHIGRIFDMFYRASDYSSGSGLGLYIVKEAVKVLKGEIKVSSVLEQGTKFKIRFPNRLTNA